jgi:hypothetical protein
MGFNLTWIAVRGRPRDEVLNSLGLRATGEREEIAESDLLGIQLASGWYLVLDNYLKAGLEFETAQGLSRGAEAIVCAASDMVNFYSTAEYRDGRLVWQVTSNEDVEDGKLQTFGTLPETFAEARRDHGPGEDAEVPVTLAIAVTGFRHDQDPDQADPAGFEVLAQTKTKRRGRTSRGMSVDEAFAALRGAHPATAAAEVPESTRSGGRSLAWWTWGWAVLHTGVLVFVGSRAATLYGWLAFTLLAVPLLAFLYVKGYVAYTVRRRRKDR